MSEILEHRLTIIKEYSVAKLGCGFIKETLKNIKLELPEVPKLKDIKKVMIGRDEKILNEIIKPKDKLIKALYYDNKQLHKELERQVNIIDSAEKFEKEREKEWDLEM